MAQPTRHTAPGNQLFALTAIHKINGALTQLGYSDPWETAWSGVQMFKPANRPNRLVRSAPGGAPTNKRREPRQELAKAASICVIDTGQTISCTLRDIHTRGARISVISHGGIPDEFILKSRQADLETRARVAWRRGNELGVKFIRA
jgi:hypothetical protein